jgi:DNA repair protein RadC
MAYLACLDAKHKLIACKKLSEGDALSTDVTARTVVSAALACNATTVVLAHNHISGIALPSEADKLSTRRMFTVLENVGIYLYDHYIIAGDDMVSMRESGYFNALENR